MKVFRFGLRTRLLIAFALVSAFTGAAVAAGSYLQLRDLVLTAAQDKMVSRFRTDIEREVVLDHSPSHAELAELADRLKAVVVFADDHADGNGITFQDVPSHLLGEVRLLRKTMVQRVVDDDGHAYAFVGATLGQGHGADPGVQFYRRHDFEDQRDVIARFPNAALLLVLVSLLPAFALALIAARGVLRPVRALRAGVRRVADGELDTRLTASGTDELADLVRTFNTMAAELERTVEELRRMDERSRRFVADVSHELRTPLTAMTAVVDALDEEPLTGDTSIAAGMVSTETRKLRTLVEDLIEISRFDAGVAALRTEPVDLPTLVAATLAARGWTDLVEVDLPVELVCQVDRRRIDVVLANLVSNAFRHGATPVTVELRSTADEVVVVVADSGPGLPEDVSPHVFERFYKADSARGRSDGSGLGLAIAWENVRLHGGSMETGNVPDSGARFTVRLPRDRP
ncbi:HAMP domain-containing sensor histidine kinase [Umezawaea sp. Da 62-37]|uniref:HAMP domain-containing sensor histidine kinase n=1 Tax=Umezawaea sp. Da 62-37 TaxID=3075927 RepID=UPI0028F74F82|nr:HAMP domain-containing sensor histidine kinase [Umezawaea sp. Da 62-37]WNV87717.1 HAMP domain-containing sensor histidine kinase [Umezawaea sp. Da 62-37]